MDEAQCTLIYIIIHIYSFKFGWKFLVEKWIHVRQRVLAPQAKATPQNFAKTTKIFKAVFHVRIRRNSLEIFKIDMSHCSSELQRTVNVMFMSLSTNTSDAHDIQCTVRRAMISFLVPNSA